MIFASLRRCSRAAALALLAPLALAVGCGDDERPPPPVRDGGPPRDAGGLDAGGSGADGGTPTDGGPGVDGSFDPDGGTVGCARVGEPIFLLSDPTSNDRRLAVALSADRFAIAFIAQSAALDQVHVYTLPITSGDGELHAVTSDGALHKDAAIAPAGAGWVVLWSDNGAGTYDVMGRVVSATGDPGTSAITPIATTDEREDAVDVAPWGAGLLASWVSTSAMGPVASTRRLGLDGVPTAAAQAVSTAGGTFPTQPRLFALGTTGGLSWIEPLATMGRDARLQMLDATGAASGAVQTTSYEHNAFGSLGIARSPTGAGLAVFGIAIDDLRFELRSRRVTDLGVATGLENRFVPMGSDSLLQPAVVPFAGGFLASYRLAPTDLTVMPTIRLALIAGDGGFLGDVEIAAAGGRVGSTAIAGTSTGDLLVAWADPGETSTKLWAARVACR